MSCRIVVCRVALSCIISYVVSDCRMSFNIVVCRISPERDIRQRDTTHDNLKRHTTIWNDTRHYIDQMSRNCRLSTGVEESFYCYFTHDIRNTTRHTTIWNDTRQCGTTFDIISIKCRAIVDCLPVLRKVFTGVEERFYRCALSSENDVKRRKVALNNIYSA